MGKAYKAPAPTYQRQFVISHHALERYRERVEKEHAARSDFDLGNILDERIRLSDKHQTIDDLRNVDAVTRVFQVEHHDGSVYYAVVRDQTVVTVLDETMLQKNFDNGSWKRGPMNNAFAKLSALRDVVPQSTSAKAVLIKRSGYDPSLPRDHPNNFDPTLEPTPAEVKILREGTTQDAIDLLRTKFGGRQGPPPGVPSLPGPLLVDVSTPKVDPVAEASMRVGKALTAIALAKAKLRKLDQQTKDATRALAQAEEEHAHAQIDMMNAAEKAAEETP